MVMNILVTPHVLSSHLLQTGVTGECISHPHSVVAGKIFWSNLKLLLSFVIKHNKSSHVTKHDLVLFVCYKFYINLLNNIMFWPVVFTILLHCLPFCQAIFVFVIPLALV